MLFFDTENVQPTVFCKNYNSVELCNNLNESNNDNVESVVITTVFCLRRKHAEGKNIHLAIELITKTLQTVWIKPTDVWMQAKVQGISRSTKTNHSTKRYLDSYVRTIALRNTVAQPCIRERTCVENNYNRFVNRGKVQLR